MKTTKIALLTFTAVSLALMPAAHASTRSHKEERGGPSSSAAPRTVYSEADILRRSQISYRADGGFTGVNSYGAVISCVNGQISVLKTMIDPRITRDHGRIHQTGTLDKSDYLTLWRELERTNLLNTKDGPPLRRETLDEFTYTFSLSVGNEGREFSVQAIGRPEAARHFALRSLIDRTTGMAGLWKIHDQLSSAFLTEDQ